MDSNIVKDYLESTINAELADWNAAPFQVGLFTNNLDDTDREHTIADITPLAAGGYTGVEDLDSFPAATWVSPRWESLHPDIVWTFDGSAVVTIRGAYIIDGSGDLVAWRKFAGAGIGVGFFAGQTFTLQVTRTRESTP